MSGFTLARYPALRLLVPFAMGIAVGTHWGSATVAGAIAAAGIIVYCALSLSARNAHRRVKLRSVWIVPIMIITFALGMLNAVLHRPAVLDTSSLNGKPVEAEIDEINHKDFSTSLTATLQIAGKPQILLSTRGCDYTISRGDHVRFIAHLAPITNMGNPDETDYASVMWRKGIRYTQHLTEKPEHFASANKSIISFQDVRNKLENIILETINAPAAQQLVIAMLLGDSMIIDTDTRNDFGDAGVAHVLALSGLHVGIVAWIVWLLLMPLDFLKLKKLRLAITIIAIATFCAITGFSPSVVRASIMIAISFISYIVFRRYPAINATAVAALIILLFTPFRLFSIGFQLSFITVAAMIVTFRRWQIPVTNVVLKYILSIIATSLVAMIITMMITAHYFHTLSLISPIANVIIVPLVPVIIVLGLSLLVAALMGIDTSALAQVTEALCNFTRQAVHMLSDTPGSHISNVYVSTTTLLLYTAMLAFIAWWILSPGKRTACAALAMMVAMVVSHIVTTARTPAAGLVVLNNFTCTPIVAFDHGRAMLWVPDNDNSPYLSPQNFKQHHRAFMAHYHIDSIAVVTGSDLHCTTGIEAKPPLAWVMGKRIVVVDHRRDIDFIAPSGISNDIIVVGKHLQTDSVRAGRGTTMVLSGARQGIATGIATTAITHDLATDGAYMLLFD